MTPEKKEYLLQLEKIGLSARESMVYFATLEMGRGTVSQISRKAGINRTTGYDILDSLTQHGLVRISGKEPKQEYVAESPDKIQTYLSNKISDIQSTLKNAQALIPKLSAIAKVASRPEVRFYEGIDGLKTVYEDTLTASEPIVAYAAYEDMHATLGDYFPKYYKRRAEKGISIRGIVPETEASRERQKSNDEEKRDIAIIPKEYFDITPDIEIYDNKVMIASWREKLGIIIESEEIAHAMKKVFELAFAEAKRIVREEKEVTQ